MDKKLAKWTDQDILSLCNREFRFRSKGDCAEKMTYLREKYVVSTKDLDADDAHSEGFVMWVRGFDVTPEERARGVTGNYAHVYMLETVDKRWALGIKKIVHDVRHHPHRRREKQDTPDWGHPFLRHAKKAASFRSRKEALDAFISFRRAFPKTVLLYGDSDGLGPISLRAIVYRAGEDPPSKKILIRASEDQFGNYVVQVSDWVDPRTLSRFKVDELIEEPTLWPDQNQ